RLHPPPQHLPVEGLRFLCLLRHELEPNELPRKRLAIRHGVDSFPPEDERARRRPTSPHHDFAPHADRSTRQSSPTPPRGAPAERSVTQGPRCRGRDSNPQAALATADFKSAAFTISPPRR